MFSIIFMSVVLGMVNAIDWNALIRRCLAKAGYTMKQACHEMQIDPAQFERQLAGEGHLSLKRLALLNDDFVARFAVEIHQQVGPPDDYNATRRLQVLAGAKALQQERSL